MSLFMPLEFTPVDPFLNSGGRVVLSLSPTPSEGARFRGLDLNPLGPCTADASGQNIDSQLSEPLLLL